MPLIILAEHVLGTTTQLRFRRYANGLLAFEEVTAGRPEKRKHLGRTILPGLGKALFAALATVANETPSASPKS